MRDKSWPTSLRTRVDEHIQLGSTETKRETLLLPSRRNQLAPIARLPPEVLGEVFLTFVRTFVQENYSTYQSYPRYDGPHWLVITAVCRYWHQVALQTPRIWSFILLRHRDLEPVSLFLERSGRVPLDMTQPLWIQDSPLPSALLRVVAGNMCRLQSLSLSLDGEFFSSPTTSLGAPHLNSVSFTFPAPQAEPTLISSPC